MDPQLPQEKKRPNYVFNFCVGLVFLASSVFLFRLISEGHCAEYHWGKDPSGSGAIAALGFLVIFGLEYASCFGIKTAIERIRERQYLPAFFVILASLLALGPIFFVAIMEGLVFGIC